MHWDQLLEALLVKGRERPHTRLLVPSTLLRTPVVLGFSLYTYPSNSSGTSLNTSS